jgi:RNA recognition motif-containing protein
MYDSSTGQHKGYAFVRFSDAGECQRALALGRNPTGTGLTLRGRPLRISEASSTGSGSVRRAESPLPSPALNRPGYFRQTTADGQDSAVSYASGPVSSYPFPEPRSRPQHFQPSRDIHSPLPRSPTGNIPPPVLADLLNELHEPENSTIFVGNLPSSISGQSWLLRPERV